jgi:cell division protein FtsN
MTRDYKYRAQAHHHRQTSPAKRAERRWLLIVLLVGAFAGFLIYLRLAGLSAENNSEAPQVIVKPQKAVAAPQPVKPFEPTFDFYTILPEQEVVVSEPEIKTRAREEIIGKSKNALYVIQAGSFRDPLDAEKVKARLAALGIVAKIEAAKNGNSVWSRVKIGPLSAMTKVDAIRSRLRDQGIDAIVMQISK